MKERDPETSKQVRGETLKRPGWKRTDPDGSHVFLFSRKLEGRGEGRLTSTRTLVTVTGTSCMGPTPWSIPGSHFKVHDS